MEFVRYSNRGLLPQRQDVDFGVQTGYRVPLFDISVTAQKQSAYSRMSQNEMALQFYSAGFFDPRMAKQALICLDMMDFDRKETVMQQVARNAAQYRQSLRLAQEQEQEKAAYRKPHVPKEKQEHYAARTARQRVANSTAPV